MREEKIVILELGNYLLNFNTIAKVTKRFLASYGNEWILQKGSQWEIVINSNVHQDYYPIETRIKSELGRLNRIHNDLVTFGLIE